WGGAKRCARRAPGRRRGARSSRPAGVVSPLGAGCPSAILLVRLVRCAGDAGGRRESGIFPPVRAPPRRVTGHILSDRHCPAGSAGTGCAAVGAVTELR